MSATSRTLLVGGGAMGQALLAGWVARAWSPSTLSVVEPDPQRAATIRRRFGIEVTSTVADATSDRFDLVVLAVKPQVMATAAPAYAAHAAAGAVALSIAAGCTISALQGWLGPTAAIVRAMPNTPAAVGRGVSVACANDNVAADQRARCDAALAAVGEVAWVEDESLLDPATAVSGCGPAYVFLFVECLSAAGIAAGLPQQLADRLARATASGAGELLRLSAESPAGLRAQVTSPRGATAAGLTALMDGAALQTLITEAVRRATDRSRALAP